MLILTRRIGETLKIGDDVSLMVLGVQGNQVRIGADAPKHIAIHREEIYRRIQQEKQNGGQATPPPKPAKAPSSNSQNHSPRNSYNAHNSMGNSHNSYNSYNSYNAPNGNQAPNTRTNNDKPYKSRDDFNKPYTARPDYGNQQDTSTENTRFYSTEGNAQNKQKKAPNVIVKKKRVIEGL